MLIGLTKIKTATTIYYLIRDNCEYVTDKIVKITNSI
jgi:hypothetical protein